MTTFTRGAAPGATHYYDPMRGFAFITPKRSQFEYDEEFRQSDFEIAEEGRYSSFEFAQSLRESRHNVLVHGKRFRSGDMPRWPGWGNEEVVF